jgi:hypothetical protein
MSNTLTLRARQRLRALYRYVTALEHGDLDALGAVLGEAESDAGLEHMILATHEATGGDDATLVDRAAIAQARAFVAAYRVAAIPAVEQVQGNTSLVGRFGRRARARTKGREEQAVVVLPDPEMATGQASHATGHRPQRSHGRLRVLVGTLAAVLMVSVLVTSFIAVFALKSGWPFGRYTSSFQPPTGWNDITPPTSDPIASYAISPDVPGLMFACTGAMAGNVSESGYGPGTLWRTRDGGSYWERLDVSGLIPGCDMGMPLGGRGTIFINNGSILVSHDGGDTWHTVYKNADSAGLYEGDYFLLLPNTVYRGGRLYAPGPVARPGAAGYSATAFSVSRDDGHTWSNVEVAADPLAQQGFGTLAIAPDYRTPNAWFRLLGILGFSVPMTTVLEHSADGGQTWTVRSQVGPRADLWADGYAGLTTNPAQPDRICAGLEALQISRTPATTSAVSALVAAPGKGVAASVSLAAQYAVAGPPGPIPHDDVLAASDDGGLTWSSGTIAHTRDYGRPTFSPINPTGDCFMADNYFSGSLDDMATIWRLAPGAGAQPQVVTQLVGQQVEGLTVTLDHDNRTLRFIALIRATAALVPGAPSEQSHLVWTDKL